MSLVLRLDHGINDRFVKLLLVASMGVACTNEEERVDQRSSSETEQQVSPFETNFETDQLQGKEKTGLAGVAFRLKSSAGDLRRIGGIYRRATSVEQTSYGLAGTSFSELISEAERKLSDEASKLEAAGTDGNTLASSVGTAAEDAQRLTDSVSSEQVAREATITSAESTKSQTSDLLGNIKAFDAALDAREALDHLFDTHNDLVNQNERLSSSIQMFRQTNEAFEVSLASMPQDLDNMDLSLQALRGTIGDFESSINEIKEGTGAVIDVEVARLEGGQAIILELIANENRVDVKTALDEVSGILAQAIRNLSAASSNLTSELAIQATLLSEQMQLIETQQVAVDSLRDRYTSFEFLLADYKSNTEKLVDIHSDISIILAEQSSLLDDLQNALEIVIEEVGAIQVCTYDELLQIREERFQKAHFELACDIDMEGRYWNGRSFYGVLDGKGHTISNLEMNKNGTRAENPSFFKDLVDATIKNINFVDAETFRNLPTESNDYFPVRDVGVIAKIANDTTFENVMVSGVIEMGVFNAGGFVGKGSNLTFTDVRSDVRIKNDFRYSTSRHEASGSYPNGDIPGHTVGGLVGRIFEGYFLVNTCNTKFHVANVNNSIGGLVGIVFPNAQVEITDCHVESTMLEAVHTLGGMIGDLRSDSSELKDPNSRADVSNSHVTFSVDGVHSMGGLIGKVASEITVSNTHVTASVDGVHSMGGLVGKVASDFTAANVTVNADLTAVSKAGGFVGELQGYALSDERRATVSISNASVLGKIYGNHTLGGAIGSLSNGADLTLFQVAADMNMQVHHTAGGLIGEIASGAKTVIRESAARGEMTQWRPAEPSFSVGGVAGRNSCSTLRILNSYTAMKITADREAGGILGRNSDCSVAPTSFYTRAVFATGAITKAANQFSTGRDFGGIVGYEQTETSNVARTYWDKEEAGVATSPHGVGLTTAEMFQQSFYNRFNFDSIWEAPADAYPTLRGLPNQ